MCIAVFPLLFSQIAVGFVLALFGLFDQLRGGDPHHIMRGAWREKEETMPLAATAIVVPVYNEDVDRVSTGVANMWRSLEKTGQLEHFDFYICSDSNDADRWVEEECAWLSLCQKLNAFGKIFYRKRRHRDQRQERQRGRLLPPLGQALPLHDRARCRQRDGRRRRWCGWCARWRPIPRSGILQTQPYMVLGTSLFRRVLQFSSQRLRRPFLAGLQHGADVVGLVLGT